MAYHPYTLLTAFLRKGTVPHGLLFSGVEGVGKRVAAMTFAMACNCAEAEGEERWTLVSGPWSAEGSRWAVENDGVLKTVIPCGICRSCKKIQSGNHPDISLTEPSGPFIRIAQIREICHTLSMKPYEARTRVLIIADAHAMNPEAGNALLKMLEEPPERTVVILTASQISDLLPTIVSRCQHIRFIPIPRQRLEALLLEKQNVGPEDAAVIAAMADGSYSRACAMSSPSWRSRRKWLIDETGALASGDRAIRMGRMLAFTEKLSKNKDVLSDSMEVIKSWLRDLIISKYDPGKIVNRDMAEQIREVSQNISVPSLLSKMEAVQSAEKKIRANANPRLTMEALMIRMGE